ncbi:MAG: hypothetical protein FK730_13175 [Asgard group archaeon]|nr:hypothetical protein [Asgard group archaeon]
MKKSGVILTIVLIILISGGTFMVGFLWARDFQFIISPTEITPELDGIIEKKEWSRATYNNIAFYLDVDNTIDPIESKSNVDGWNYMHIAEDADYYYVALDLCSDRTNNMEDEWISYFVANRMPEIYGSSLALHSLVDRGFEYVYYNVSGDNVFPDDQDVGGGSNNFYDIPIVPETDIIDVMIGNTSSTYLDFWHNNDGKEYSIESYFTLPAVLWDEANYIDLQFGIDIGEKMPNIDTASFVSAITDMDLYYRMGSNLESNPGDHISFAERFFCTIAEHGGMPSEHSDPLFLVDDNLVFFPADTMINGNVDLDNNNINATDDMFYFTIHCYNEFNATYPTDFILNIDNLALKFTTTNYHTTVGSTVAPTNYDIAWSYGPSENCVEDHRMFEFRIAKAEFPNVDDDMLYLCVAGYGTMAITGTNFWQYPVYGFPMTPIMSFINDHNDFLAFDMSST